MTPAAGFDIDLTLVDTRERILTSVVAAFADLGVAVDPADVVPHLGVPLEHKVAALAPQLDVDAFRDAYRGHYVAPGAAPAPALRGAREALGAVRDLGHRVVVVSAKRADLAAAAIEEAGLADLVDVVHGGAFGAGKSVPLRAEGAWLYLGDHPGDIEAARGADAVAAVVTTGAHDAGALAAADIVLPDLLAFPAAYTRALAERP